MVIRIGIPVTGKKPDGQLAYCYEFSAEKRRLVARYIGVWDEETARNALAVFREMLQAISAQVPSFTLLDDFREFGVQPPEVTKVADEFDTVARMFPITRNALVIPNGEIRRQVRLTLQDFYANSIFFTLEEAENWLSVDEP